MSRVQVAAADAGLHVMQCCPERKGLSVSWLCCAGDSRAVLCRGSIAIPLTDDHKAAREDETVRAPPARTFCGCVSSLTQILHCPVMRRSAHQVRL